MLDGSISGADVGAAHAYRFLPVRLLMKDQFRSDLRIAGVIAPLLFLHGGRDWVVPIALGERLYALANEPMRETQPFGCRPASLRKDIYGRLIYLGDDVTRFYGRECWVTRVGEPELPCTDLRAR